MKEKRKNKQPKNKDRKEVAVGGGGVVGTEAVVKGCEINDFVVRLS